MDIQRYPTSANDRRHRKNVWISMTLEKDAKDVDIWDVEGDR